METAVVRVTVAPVLALRSMSSEQVTQALLGASVEILERVPRWARLRMDDGYEGWMSNGHLAPALPPDSTVVTVTDLWVNLRTRPDYRMPARRVACIGTRLPLHEREPGWLAVKLPAGGIGWLEEHRGRIEEPDAQPPLPDADTLLTTARRFLGVPYLWGGCSPFGLDCSGFVQLVHRLHGVRLPRDADPQAMVGEPIEPTPDSTGAGDAVFFAGEADPARITHVGLARGDGTFIHAAGSDCVRINPLFDSPYGQRLVCARRYLTQRPGSVSHIELSAAC